VVTLKRCKNRGPWGLKPRGKKMGGYREVPKNLKARNLGGHPKKKKNTKKPPEETKALLGGSPKDSRGKTPPKKVR